MIIGFPRSLIYWKANGTVFWKTFFEELGIGVLVSPETNKEIIVAGTKLADSEACFSVKVFFSHVLWLDSRADRIFVPRLIKDETGMEYCPRFFGLPDIVSLVAKKPIISPWIDMKKESFEDSAYHIGKEFSNDPEVIERAIKKGMEEVEKEKKAKNESFFKKMASGGRKIILISHPYNIYDSYINLGIEKKLANLGAELIFIDEVPALSDILAGDTESPAWHWEFGQEILNQLEAVSSRYKLDGAIEISAFQCGCDAVLKEFAEKKMKEKNIPFLYLLIDEHTAEAGVQTRMEAFIDTLK